VRGGRSDPGSWSARRALAEAVSDLASGLNVESANGFAEVGARGVLITADYGNHVLVLLDGHSLNEAFYYANSARIENRGVTADWEGSGLGQRLRYGASLTLSRARGCRAT